MPVDNKRLTDEGRRGFLLGSGAVLGASWLAVNLPLVAKAAEAAHEARAAGEAFANLTPGQGADLAAIAARIVPSDETPGATEAGAVWFIDKALEGFLAEDAASLTGGLAALNAFVLAETGREGFALLDEARQDEVLRAREETPFFDLVRFLTLAGLFTMPSYGGNRDHVGWKLVGFEHRHAWTPPFGFYDGQAGEESEGHG
jgi:gluconate 2-dehydrogenase gamma chain